MLLSIAMIVKNEEQYLDECLSKLKEIGEKIDSEIIVIDTGSIDSSVDIAKKYTNKIYVESWNGNFSDMRNISLSYCTGKWVMIVDADEILVDSSAISEFFLSKKYMKYSSASVRLDNITNRSTGQCVIYNTIRLYKNSQDLKYSGRVHEQINFQEPTAETDIQFIHYGYQSDDIKKMIYKFNRNKDLLLIDQKDNPNNAYTLFQLYQTYSMAKYYQEAHKYATKAYELAKKNNELKSKPYIQQGYFYSMFNLKRFNECLSELDNVKINMKSNESYNLDYYYIGGISAFSKEKLEIAIAYFNAFLQLKKKIVGKTCKVDLLCPINSYDKTEEVKMLLIEAYFKLDDYKQVIDIYYNEENNEIKRKIERYTVKSLIKESQFDKLKELLKSIDVTNEMVNDICIELKDNFNDNVMDIKLLIGINRNIDKYILICILEDAEDLNIDIDDFNESFLWYKGEILKKKIIRKKIEIEELKKLRIYDSRYINFIMGDFFVENYFIEYIDSNYLKTDLESVVFNKKVAEELIFRKINQLDKQEIYRMIHINNMYIDKVYKGSIYNNDISKNILTYLECFWIDLYHVHTMRSAKIDYIGQLKKLLKKYPEYNKIIDNIITFIDDVVISQEMYLEKQNILKVTEEMINNGQLSDAQEVLIELRNTFFEDKEILSQLGLIKYIEGKYDEAINIFVNALYCDFESFEGYYNIATVLEVKQRVVDSKYYYQKAYEKCDDESTKKIIKERIDSN